MSNESNLFRINVKDIVRGIFAALFTGAFMAIAGIVSAVGFDVFAADWVSIGKIAVNGGFSGFIAYVGTMFFSDRRGQVLGAV